MYKNNSSLACSTELFLLEVLNNTAEIEDNVVTCTNKTLSQDFLKENYILETLMIAIILLPVQPNCICYRVCWRQSWRS